VKAIPSATLAVTLAALCASSASAFTDKASGFSIIPPAGFMAKQSSHKRHDVAVVVNSTTRSPPAVNSDGTLCKLAYKSAPQNNKLTREHINAIVSSPARITIVKSAFERIFRISKADLFVHAGYKGLELHGTPKSGPNAANARVFISLVETRKGRASLICATASGAFASALKDFRAIRSGMIVPD